MGDRRQVGLKTKFTDVDCPSSNLPSVATARGLDGKREARVMEKMLRKAPLAEAIFELHWTLEGTGITFPPAEGTAPQLGAPLVDSEAGVLPGILMTALKDDYPVHVTLPAAQMPNEVGPFFVRHQFRASADSWPLVQLGPGILTVNEATDYEWDRYGGNIERVLDAFGSSHPRSKEVKILNVTLRYINSIPFSVSEDSFVEFLGKHLDTEIGVKKNVLDAAGSSPKPIELDARVSYSTQSPSGYMHLRFATGKYDDAEALIWEISQQANRGDAPSSLDQVKEWLQKAHMAIENVFFEMLSSELRGRFE